MTGLIIYAAIQIGKSSIKDKAGMVIAAASFLLLTTVRLSVVLLIMLGAAAGLVLVLGFKAGMEKGV